MKSSDAVATIRRVSAMAALVAATLATGYAMGETYNDGTIKWTYSIIDETSKSVEIETAESAVYIGKIAGDVIVPGNVDGYTVTSIGDSAFYNCCALYSVTIPDSVKFIGDSAFYLCFNLESVTFGNSVTRIGNRAFYLCIGLTSVTIPDSVTSIGDRAFDGCSGLTSVTIVNAVTSIGASAFSGCTGLTSVTMGD